MKKRLNEIEDHIVELLARYYTDEASAQERAEAEAWIALTEENKKYANQIKVIIENAAQVKATHTYSTDKAWIKVESKINEAETKVVALNPKAGIWQWTMRIAASVLLLISIIYIGQQWFIPKNIELNLQSENTVLQDTLPDGTAIVLNKNSSMAYVADKKGSQQRVQLKGEAHFSMAETKASDFVIETFGVYVHDIGTKFNLRSYSDEEEIIVAVEEGEVKFYSDKDEGIHVFAGETGYYNKHEQKFYKNEVIDVNMLAYKTKVFVFNNASLAIIINALNDVYNTHIQLSGNIGNCQVTVSFKDESIESIADILAETLGLAHQISGNEIILEGEGCEQ